MRPFEDILGNNAELRLVEFLLPLEGMEFTSKDLSEEIGTDVNNIDKILDKFIKWDMVKKIVKNDIVYYTINNESNIIEKIIELNNAIIENILGDEILYGIYEYWEIRRSGN